MRRGHCGDMGKWPRHDDTAGHGLGNLLVFLVACRSCGDVPKRDVGQHGCVTSESHAPSPAHGPGGGCKAVATDRAIEAPEAVTFCQISCA